MQDSLRRFYNSKAWKKLRANKKAEDQYLCQDCLKRGIITPAIEVHHIIPVTPENVNDPSITLNADNLVSLCRCCHRARHEHNNKRYTIDEFGHVTIIR